MSESIRRAAVLGAGTMGAQIAGHLANAGIPSLLFDLNSDLTKKGIETLQELKPAPLFDRGSVSLIEPCTYADHLPRLSEADWVIEAVAENLDVKHKVFASIAPHLRADVFLSTNTSGLPLKAISTALPESLRARFVLTHFFNPPRYLPLVELVRGDATDDVVARLSEFLEEKLGKGVVRAKDTPNFIANRIGVYGMMVTIRLAEEMGLTVEEVDKLTGTIAGRPKSATFRTADVVGLDILARVAKTSYENCPQDEEREMFAPPKVLEALVSSGRLGQKTRAGFYKKDGDEILSLDFKTLDYRPKKLVRVDAIRMAKDYTSGAARLRALASSDDRAGQFFWQVLSRTLIYTANRIPEIADSIADVDNAMRWGFGWESGPFETWDALGVAPTVRRMKEEGKKIPAWVEEMLASGFRAFYETSCGTKTVFSPLTRRPEVVAAGAKSISLAVQKSAGHLIRRDWSGSLVDLGDGILNVEFHSALQPQMNPIDSSLAQTINDGLDLIEAGKFRGMVLGHHGANFCAGANLKLILTGCESDDWKGLERLIKNLQDLTQRMRFSKGPVVAAPFGLVLGGGYELIGPCARRVASAELYCGLVEVGVGLIPGAGGNLRVLLNLIDRADGKANAFQISQQALEIIGFAKVSTSASHARKLGYLRLEDEFVMNRDHLLHRAKQTALALAEHYQPPRYRDDIVLAGKGGRIAMTVALKGYRLQGKISAHDELIAQKLSFVLTGGDKGGAGKPMDEQYLLDIEREAFLSLCGEPKSHDRIRYMLKNSKPLRN